MKASRDFQSGAVSQGSACARKSCAAFLVLILASVTLLPASCGFKAPSRVQTPGSTSPPADPEGNIPERPAIAAALDDSFRLMFPVASARFSGFPDAMGGKSLSGRAGEPGKVSAPLPVSSLPMAVAERQKQWSRQAGSAPEVIIASPAVAAEFLRGGAGAPEVPGGLELPRFVVAFGSAGAEPLPGVDVIAFDYVAAYAALGRKAARTLPGPSPEGSPSRCTIVFQENFMRDKKALSSFAAAFDAEAGPGRLEQRILGPDELAVDRSGALESTVGRIMESEGGPSLLVLAVDDAFTARKIASDLARIRKEGKKKVPQLFADAGSWDEASASDRAFSILVTLDEQKLADVAIRAAKKAESGADAGNASDTPGSLTLVGLKISGPHFRIF